MKGMFCGTCSLNDGSVYTSDPVMYRCTVDGKYHFGNERCTYKDYDFVPVVRCGNCAKRGKNRRSIPGGCPFGITDDTCDPDAYCSYGVLSMKMGRR